MTAKTRAEQDAETTKVTRYLLAGIALVAAAVSYWTQKGLLLSHDADRLSAWAIPTTVDFGVIVCSIVINTKAVDAAAKRIAWVVLSVAAAVSVVANFISGDNWVLRIAHVWCVAIYIGTEAVASRARTRKPPARRTATEAASAAPRKRATAAKKTATPRKRATAAVPTPEPTPAPEPAVETVTAPPMKSREPELVAL